MIRFIKEAIREFKHVVWPTRKETQKYFSLVLAMLIAFGVYLFVASNIFSEVIFGLKSILGPEQEIVGQSGLTDEDIDALFSNEVGIEIDAVTVEGEEVSTTTSETQEVEAEESITDETASGTTAE